MGNKAMDRGTFTNFPEVSKNFRKLRDLEKRLKMKMKRHCLPREKSENGRRKDRSWKVFMEVLPRLIKFPMLFSWLIHILRIWLYENDSNECQKCRITDTNSDPTVVDYPIPAMMMPSGHSNWLLSIYWMHGERGRSWNWKLRIEKLEEIKKGKVPPTLKAMRASKQK